MGRKKKIGLTWFRMDVDIFQDIKIRKLIRRQGGKAFTVYALLLGSIYRNGYYMRWDTELPFIISEQTGYDEVYIQEVIKSCLSLGLFSEKLFNTEGVLTSIGIQTRYLDALNYMKRKAEIEEYSLLSDEDYDEAPVQKTSKNMPISPKKSEEISISSEEKKISSEETTISSEESTQRERIEKNIKEISPDGDTKKSPEDLSLPTPPIPYQKIVEMWNTTCTGFHRLTGLSDKRKMKLRNRYEELSKMGEPLPLFQTLFEKMENTPFLKGDNRRGWKATFDWLISNGENWRKVMEGNYEKENSYGNTWNNTAKSGNAGYLGGRLREPTEADYPTTI